MRPTKKITLPPLSQELAYFCGVLVGDGYIGIRPHKYDYVINCGGNPKDEKEFYDFTISPMFEKLFGVSINTQHLSSGTYGFYFYSKTLVNYLIDEVGLQKSPKNNLKVPEVFYSNKLSLSFIRGVADTDFSFQIKKRNYPKIVGSSKCKQLIIDISTILKSHGFKVLTYLDYKVKDSRLREGFSAISKIELNGHKNFELWVNLIGTRQPKNLKKIKIWRKNSGGRI